MNLKTATKLAIIGWIGLISTFAFEWGCRHFEVTLDFWNLASPILSGVNLISRILVLLFFVSLHKNQK